MSNEKMSADEVLATVRIELLAAMRDGDDPWDHVEKHPVVKRFDAAVAALIAERDALREALSIAEKYMDVESSEDDWNAYREALAWADGCNADQS